MENSEKPQAENPFPPSPSLVGRLALLLAGDRYELRIPRLFGSYDLICDPGRGEPRDFSDDPRGQSRPFFNVIDSVQDLSAAVRDALKPDDCDRLVQLFRLAGEAYQALDAAYGRPWVREAKADLAESTARILSPAPGLGESRWASLLAAERAFKAFIVTGGQRAMHSHNLLELAQTAENHGLVPVPLSWVSAVQCEEGVLEGEPTVGLEEAVRAQECAFKIVRHALVGIPRFGP